MKNDFKDKVKKYKALASDRVKITDSYIEFLNDKGQLHREDGPALEYSDGEKYWYINEKLHREDGPAIEKIYGYNKYYIYGKEYDAEKYWLEIEKLKILKNI